MDRLSQFTGIFVLVAAAMTILQSWDHFHQEGWVKGETISLLLFSVTGMMLFAATSHFVVLFLGLELFSIPLYALVGTVRARSESAEGGMKYFLTGAVASSCFLWIAPAAASRSPRFENPRHRAILAVLAGVAKWQTRRTQNPFPPKGVSVRVRPPVPVDGPRRGPSCGEPFEEVQLTA